MNTFLYQEFPETKCEYQPPSEGDILPYLGDHGECESNCPQESDIPEEARKRSQYDQVLYVHDRPHPRMTHDA